MGAERKDSRDVVRPVLEKDPSEQIVVLGRMLRQVVIDPRYSKRRKKRLERMISDLMSEFQKEVIDGGRAVVDG
jgi:hypothetical protein